MEDNQTCWLVGLLLNKSPLVQSLIVVPDRVSSLLTYATVALKGTGQKCIKEGSISRPLPYTVGPLVEVLWDKLMVES